VNKRREQRPPTHVSPEAKHDPLGLHVLDKFSSQDLVEWNSLSKDLDELQRALYFEIHPMRMRRKEELIVALSLANAKPFNFSDWHRIVDFKYSNAPLSVIGSVKSYGGRFNIGRDVEESIYGPFPALYLGDSYETAFREKYQASSEERPANGLTPEDMALCKSTTNVVMKGCIQKVLDVSNPLILGPFCAVIAKIKMPESVQKLAKKLKAGRKEVYMIKTPMQLSHALHEQNWRASPVQFGIPSISQQFAELVKEAGYEGIIYRSSKNPTGRCLALFADNIGSDRTFIELVDQAPDSVLHTKLDLSTVDDLMKE
jgi:RES domain